MENPAREATGKLGTYSYQSAAQGERTITEIVKDIVGNIQGIIRAEVRLARQEIKDEGRKVMAASTMLLAGAVFGLFALGFLLLTAVRALELVVTPWLATLIVGVLLCLCTAVLMSIGRERLRKVRIAEKTAETLKEDIEWMKEQVRS